MEEQVVKTVPLDSQQDTAVALCVDLKRRLAAVTGPAGSGKTTIIKTVVEILRKMGITVVLAAPTGKAARRIKEATGVNAVTVHKLLEYNRPGERDPETGEALDVTKPKRNRENPLEAQVVIVDEYAMMNYELHDNLMAAMPRGGAVRAFGDVNQLPPIEPHGSNVYDSRKEVRLTPFQKLLARDGDNVILEKVYRQEEGSNILDVADRIRRGWQIPINQDLGDFYVQITDKPIHLLKSHVLKMLEIGINYGTIDHQIITPSRKSWVGTDQLNDVLRSLLNPNPDQRIELPRHEYAKHRLVVGLGDKVVCTENTYDLRDYFERYSEWDEEMRPIFHTWIPTPDTKQMLNGETGIITQIYPDGALDIDFGDRIVEVPAQMSEYWAKKDTIITNYPLKAIDLAYALTTHKCQGSEFETIIYVLNKTTLFAQSRQNFYTGLTRAKKSAFVIADQASIRTSVMKVIR
jgi:exodeoxyribonuclease V alpha subunit